MLPPPAASRMRPRPRNTVSQSAESGYKGNETISRPDQARPSPAELSSAEHADTANATTATDALSTLSICIPSQHTGYMIYPADRLINHADGLKVVAPSVAA